MDELYEQNAQIVYRFLYSICRNEHLAEDLTQETFLQAYKSIERFDGSCKISSWLCQIAKHLLYRHYQKTKREIPSELEEMASPAETAPAPDGRVMAKLELMEVLKDMQKLPPAMREVIYLRITGELTFREIGEIMGRSENWARVTFYRGKEILWKQRKKF
ncbi:MAG: sigma-70 family RNA polymerase sigma factor [Lachnospiraceae bacterium]|nr:sigma-70 family RNA polymerase sigma factor [Lachnospiraceae bacterium]